MAIDETGRVGLPPGIGENPDDIALVAQVAQGSEDALVTLHGRYVNLVYSLSLHILGDPMATEEVTQDVFVKLWRQPRAYDPSRGRFPSWLLTVTRHAAIDHLRQQGRRPALVSTPAGKNTNIVREQVAPTGNPHSEAHQDFRIVLRQLSSDQRQVIELAYFGGMSQQDIAEYLSLPLGTVKTRIRLGIQHLRAMWQQNQ